MKLFFDTSVFVAAFSETHPEHLPSNRLCKRIINKEDTGYCSTHALAETFSVFVRLNSIPRLRQVDTLALLETNIIPHFVAVPLEFSDYIYAIRLCANKRLGGGRVYDLLHLRAAEKLQVDVIYTLNLSEWLMLAPEFADKIKVPGSE